MVTLHHTSFPSYPGIGTSEQNITCAKDRSTVQAHIYLSTWPVRTHALLVLLLSVVRAHWWEEIAQVRNIERKPGYYSTSGTPYPSFLPCLLTWA